ncbi:MAG: tetratricopeptide repeat protein [Flavobacteriaceae bacterium]|nr:tetratricopeptide repeat protein [Flavobacteriaceae bacterium]
MKHTLLLFVLVLSIACKSKENQPPIDSTQHILIDTFQGTSFLNQSLTRRQVDAEKDSVQLKLYKEARANYEASKTADHIIWVGRRIAYLGDYKKAISYFSEGVRLYPFDARFLRHRGHRYISIRKLDQAINDYQSAVKLIAGKEDLVEPDGMPNKMNIPLSSLHNNIWYHLGLAYYLKNDMENALNAFQECLAVSNNDDMQVAVRHWLYMILRRMEKLEAAEDILVPIHDEMNIIENTAYYNLLRFYKGTLTEDELIGNGSLGSNEAVQYGLGNWYYYNGDESKASEIYNTLLQNGNWAGFGYIAAEADMAKLMQSSF